MVKQGQPGRRKHVPVRTCVACRNPFPKRSLVRIVYSAELGLMVDPTGKLAGRGAYLCHAPACWEKALSQPRILAQALRANLTDSDRETLVARKQALTDESVPTPS